MTTTEELRQQAEDLGAEVMKWRFESERIKGLYCDGTIALSDRLNSTAEEAAILAEEIGHHLTASGNILDQSNIESRKQEIRGRVWSYDRLIGLSGLISAFDAGCTNRFEIADFLGVPEDVLQDAINYYHGKYGLYCSVGHYIVFFEPLRVIYRDGGAE